LTRDADEAPTSAERRRLSILGAATLAAAGWLVAGVAAAVLLAAATPVALRAALAARRRRWRNGLADAAPTVARAMADARAGGHSIRGALAEAARGGGLEPAARVELSGVA